MNYKKFVELLWIAVQKRDSHLPTYEIWKFRPFYLPKNGLLRPLSDVGYLHEESPT